MVTTTSAIPALLDALRAKLIARPLFVSDGIAVYTGGMGMSTPPEAIILGASSRGDIESDQDWEAVGNRYRMQTFTIPGVVWLRTTAGNDEDAIKAVRDRAYVLFAEIEDAIRSDPRISETVTSAQAADTDLAQDANPDGRWCQLDFEIRGSAALVST